MTPEAELKSVMAKLEWTCVRKEWIRRIRSKEIKGPYSDISVALKELVQVIGLVIRGYKKTSKGV